MGSLDGELLAVLECGRLLDEGVWALLAAERGA